MAHLDPQTRIADLDEVALLEHLFPHLPVNDLIITPPGDDAAVMAAPDGAYVITSDMMIGEADWLSQWSSAYEVGQRLAAQNLADIAAMGAYPSGVVLSFAFPPQTTLAWVDELYRGISERCAQAGAAIIGGDLSGGKQIILNATVTGDLRGETAVTRSGARPGDLICLAGTLGRSGAGLDLCHAGYAHQEARNQLPEGTRAVVEVCVSIFKAARPPLEAGPAAARAGAHAMLDVSDGLGKDLRRILRASSQSRGQTLAARLETKALTPFVNFLAPAGELIGVDPWQWVMAGGEDHPLLAVFSDSAKVPEDFRPIGRIIEAEAQLADSKPAIYLDDQLYEGVGGWDHYGESEKVHSMTRSCE
ncbi:thiamine-phosphate kinase [Boudabousia liubingyangii]|uniref:thiamine-phosphate kinase n=1 Tax=Boudabousia liubingyangii TaxID=1921764 RepID=UPI00093E1109|nr:thiamine-phosphate kinase [Boudabousia liubingyangii]OKL47562.1 thiamine-phosphate kinase [Boudabousia liubingyangii]